MSKVLFDSPESAVKIIPLKATRCNNKNCNFTCQIIVKHTNIKYKKQKKFNNTTLICFFFVPTSISAALVLIHSKL